MPVLREQPVGCCNHDDSAGLELGIERAKRFCPVTGQNVLEDLGRNDQIDRFVIYPRKIIAIIDEKICAVIVMPQILHSGQNLLITRLRTLVESIVAEPFSYEVKDAPWIPLD